MVEDYDSVLGEKWAEIMSQVVYDAVEPQPKSWIRLARDMLTSLSCVQLRENT